MKKAIIAALICLNVGLLAALVFGEATPPANAQANYYNETNYIMVAGQIETGLEVVYIIDMATQKIGVWKFNVSDRRLIPWRSRSLASDFREN